MKKVMVMAAVAVFGFSQIQAQDGVQFGVKAGVNFAKLTGDDVEDADGRTGFHVGGVAEIPVSEKFSVQPELVYSQQGLQRKTNEGEFKLKLDYLNIPVMAKFYVADGFAIEAGPQFGFNVSAKSEVQVEGGNGNEVSEIQRELEDTVEGFDFGFGGGISYKMATGLFFQARYIIGLTSVYEASDEGLFQDDLNNSNLSLSIGYMF